MRTIELSTAFRKDYRRAKSNPKHAADVHDRLESAASLLAEDKPLPKSLKDHELIGEWKGYRECHLKPDLLLIYKKSGADSLRLARLGSHAEIFGK